MAQVTSEHTLGQFRKTELSGGALLHRLTAIEGIPLVGLPVGVGKSTAIDSVIEEGIKSGAYDLIVIFAPTRAILEERRWFQAPPTDVSTILLKARPSELCGYDRDKEWLELESRQMGTFGKQTICKRCPHHENCFWPSQMGKCLRGVKVVFATQKYLDLVPGFIAILQRATGASRPLILLDEINFVTVPYRKTIHREDLRMLSAVLSELAPHHGRKVRLWEQHVDLLLQATTSDLNYGGWRFPSLPLKIVSEVQRRGWDIYREKFRYIGFDLELFSRSRTTSRQRKRSGAIEFSAVPWLGCTSMIFSGTAWPALIHYRLNRETVPIFPDVTFRHPETRWYNIASRIGMLAYFARNSDQILDFFGTLVVRRLSEGKRPVLISKKALRDACTERIQRTFMRLGRPDLRVVTAAEWENSSDRDHLVPLLHYGMIGINAFEGFDAAYCLNGYYVQDQQIGQLLQETLRDDLHIPLKIRTDGQPLRRRLLPTNPGDGIYREFIRLGQEALEQEELGVVVQAVGRVRPFTKPREIITFQCGQIPGVDYECEFPDLSKAREYFEIENYRRSEATSKRARIAQCRDAGMSTNEASDFLGCPLRTVQRYW